MAIKKLKNVPMKIHGAFNLAGDLTSIASPNQKTDPKSAWARKRAISNMTPQQLKQYALNAQDILEYFWDYV